MELEQLINGLAEKAEAFDADLLTGDDAARVIDLCVSGERRLQAIRTMATARVDACSIANKGGHRDTAEWIAQKTGVSYQQAASEVDTARRLVNAPDTQAAMQEGRLSLTQASMVSKAVIAAPHMERQLVDAAEYSTITELKSVVKKVEATTVADDRRQAADLRRRRYHHTWIEIDGCVGYRGRMAPGEGSRHLALIEKERERLSKAESKAGRKPLQAQLKANALINLMEGGGGKVRATANVTVDHSALVSGAKEADEVCEISGVGAVPVTTVRELLDDALMRVLVIKGGDVAAYRGAGRYIPEMVDSALNFRYRVCAVPFCESTFKLERNHAEQYAKTKNTSYENLHRACAEHHKMITHKGFRLVSVAGQWCWLKPGDDPPDD
jgi:Domain of unknown function (DUF222)